MEKKKEDYLYVNQHPDKNLKKIDADKFYKEYGIYKFVRPSLIQKKEAMGLAGESICFKKIISHDFNNFYKTIPAPGPRDWLMNHKEYGQTYLEYINHGYFPVEKGKDVIYLAPLSFNINPSFDQSFITGAALIIQSYYCHLPVKILNMKMDLSGVEFRKYDDGRFQLNANSLIEKIYFQKPKDAHCVICFTDADLYNDRRCIIPRDWIYVEESYNNDFIFELNSFIYKISVMSITRFDPLYVIEDPPESKKCKIKLYFILFKRTVKMIIKNICHMMGLKNCIFFNCVMNGFNNMPEFDKRPMEVCPVCLRKAFTDMIRKYEKLEEGRVKGRTLFDRFIQIKECLETNFEGIYDEEVEWYKKRINSLISQIGLR